MSIEFRSRSEQVADQLHSAAIHLLRRLRRSDAASGLNPARLSALSVLVFRGRTTLGELADVEQVRPPTMTRIVAALEKQGLVTKEKNEHDGRNRILSATTKGKKVLLRSRRRRIQTLARQVEDLPEEDRQALEKAAELIRKLAGTGAAL
jgi:DNA-binding MarR family transcriptional regulator